MAYLFISFADRLDREINVKNELFGASLRSQFENIQRRLPLKKRASSFERFMEACFPSGMEKKYFISCPNFLREKRETSSGKTQYLDNVVIRPALTMSMASILPDNQNIILIGNIVEGGKQKYFEVKGIQLIDDSMSSPHDIVISAVACNAFSSGRGTNQYGQPYIARNWSIPNVSYDDTYFTPDNVYELIRNCYTVSNPYEVRQTYDEWEKFINFRKYYLEEQSKRNFRLDSATFVKAFAVNRKEYKRNASIYEEYLLDNRPEFTSSDMVLLSEKIEEAEEFPIVRLTIERNKKAFIAAKILKKGKLVNEEERAIRSLASDNVFITSINPNNVEGKEGARIGQLLSQGYALGDRFKVFSYEILPEDALNALDIKYNEDIDEQYQNVDSKYETVIFTELKNFLKETKKTHEKEIANAIHERKKELKDRLKEDYLENKDPVINEKIKSIKTEIRKDVIKAHPRDKKEDNSEYEERINVILKKEYSKIDVKELYEQRNEKDLASFEQRLRRDYENLFNRLEQEKHIELNNKYASDIRNEKVSIKERLDNQLKENKESVIEEETIICFALYFRLGDINNNINDHQIQIINNCQYIVYDSRAEQAKISRQEQALKNFYSGYVKNPYLSTYLFNPEELNSVQPEPSDWTWYLDSLNDMQKEAVRKAVSSNGIFLLQGPPGTGKTQVIAETVAQMVKKGKKVLISSETHKAIDNVFERLPKIAEIVPIRLIPSVAKKDNEYDPKFLIDNFYENISSNMKKSVERYKNFQKNKEEFKDSFDKLQFLKSKVDKSISVLNSANDEIKALERQTRVVNVDIEGLNNSKDSLRVQIDILRRTKRYIENNNLVPDEDTKGALIIEYRNTLSPLFSQGMFVDKDISELVKALCNVSTNDVIRETAVINPDSVKVTLDIERKKLRERINNCLDDFGDCLPGKEEKYSSLKKQLIDIKRQMEATDEKLPEDLKLAAIFKFDYLVSNLSSLADLISTLKQQINEIKYYFIEKCDGELSKLEEEQDKIDKEINTRKKFIQGINEQIIDIQERNDVRDVQSNKEKLESGVNQFFLEFEISEPYNNVDEALTIIKKKWKELETDFSKKEKENKEKIPMYEKIANYITSKDVIEGDRKGYTKDLFENANVFGITCTANDYYTPKNLDSLSEYNIDGIDIKSVGIDVVIIDEVSKSSFIDLLIPILYGKTVILVGDHRQLPPMYEFSKLRDDDFEGLDETIINKEINKKFTKLYEECFFKTLFERIPNSYKTMLVQQYRCHEHIMHVFNHFYRNELKLGWSGQNNKKKHNVRLLSNGRNIIEPDKHIYFVDCKGNETHELDSTSMYNTGEAKVVVELLKKLNGYFKANPNQEKLSVGVICTYGDQAGKIKQLLKFEKVKTDAFKTDVERMIVSTVDDFQGDERDIIILSTVRNPLNPKLSNPGFILAYQRINVALSRARRLLIIVGNKNYLETKGVIDLPDVYGRNGMDQRNFRVYEEILATIERYGKIIEDIDVLGESEVKING